MKNKIFVFPGEGLDSNIYFLEDQAALIDTGSDSRHLEFRSFLRKHGFQPSDIKYVFLTHFHEDHIGKLDMFQEAEVFAGKRKEGAKKAPEELKIGKTKFEILKTPGHTSESISIFVPEWNVIFTGDTKFSRLKWGRTDLEDSEPDKIEESIRKINWKPWYLLLPGHGQPYRRNKFLGISLRTDKTGLCFLGEDKIEFNSLETGISYILEAVNEFKPNIIAMNTSLEKELVELETKLKEKFEKERYFVIRTKPSSVKKELGGFEETYGKLGFEMEPSNEHEKSAFLSSLAGYSFVRGNARVSEDKERTVIPKEIPLKQ